MDGGGITGRMDAAVNAIKFLQGRASGLIYAHRLIPSLPGHSGYSVHGPVRRSWSTRKINM